MKFVVSVLLVFCMYQPALAESTVVNNPQELQHKFEQKLPDESADKLLLYKQLYENSIESNAQLISTIQWSIGIIATFLAALLGSQIFFNYKISKEEVKSIKSDLDEKFSEFKSDIYLASEVESKELTKSLSDEISKNERLFKEAISDQFKEKSKFVDSNINAHEKEIESFKVYSKRELDFLRLEVSKLEGEVWKLRGVNANALTRFIRCAKMEIEAGIDPKHSLDDIIDILKSASDISKKDFDELATMLALVPVEFIDKKSKIEGMSSKLNQYIFVEDPNRPGYLKTVNI